MIKLAEIISDTKIKSGQVLFHGQLHYDNTFSDFRPAFFTEDRNEAMFFATRGNGTPTMISAKVFFKNAANADIVENLVKELNIDPKEADKYGGYEAQHQNIADFLYVPRLLKKLEEMGYNAYTDWDVIETWEIPIVVVWHPRQIEIVKMEKVEHND